MAREPVGALTIGDLAGRTGVPPATLRSWELRYGFPIPTRLPGGHRRYSEADVEAIRRVVARRDAGVPVKLAVRAAAPEPVASRSVYAELRRRHPELAARILTKPTLVALSRSIEDECCARALKPVLFGGFQHARHLDASRTRWVDLARTARVAVAFTSSEGEPAGDPGALVEVEIPPEAPLLREWLVVCEADDLPACLVAVELPGNDPHLERARRFEMVWSVDPQVVQDAGRIAAALADEYAPSWRPGDLGQLVAERPSASADLARAAGVFDRLLGYLDADR